LPTIIGFAENQLSKSVLSFTTPTTVLRRFLLQSPVRTFIILTMVKSPGFGSNIRHLFVILTFGLTTHACWCSSHLILTWWPIMQKVRSRACAVELLIKLLFLFLFPHGTFHYRLCIIFSLWGRFPNIQTVLIPFYLLGFSTFAHAIYRISFDFFSWS